MSSTAAPRFSVSTGSEPLDAEPPSSGRVVTAIRRRPVTAFLTLLLVPTLSVYALVLATGATFFIAQAFELIMFLLVPLAVTAALSGRAGVKQLFAGLTRWRFGTGRWLMVLAALPVLGLAVAGLTGSLQSPEGGVTRAALSYPLFLFGGAVTANLWEETAWAGFLQTRLIDRHGLVVGSVLTAVPFSVIHLPLAFSDGLHAVTAHDVLITWAFLIGLAPFMRLLIGMLMRDSRGSTLAAGLLHAGFNATLASAFLGGGGWQAIAALVLLTGVVAVVRTRRSRR
jgi:membrane protease YdiL (CAAX protease family)